MPVIAQIIQENRLTFRFSELALSTQYDGWIHYRRRFNSASGGTTAVDLLHSQSNTGWLIEIKDYRDHPRTKAIDLADEVACKVRDTLAGLISARLHAQDVEERRIAQEMLKRDTLRVVLHLEQPHRQKRLRPKAIDPAALSQKLKALLKSIDPHPCVVDRHSLKPDMDWSVQDAPQPKAASARS